MTGERPVDLLCEHLREPLSALLAGGALIRGASDAWMRVGMNVILDRGPDRGGAEVLGLVQPPVSFWANDDSHHAVAFGLLCGRCRHALSWPQTATLRIDGAPR